MKQIIKDETSAQQKVAQINREEKPTWLCPLRDAVCSKDCICFRDAYISTNPYKNEYYIKGFCCENTMFFWGRGNYLKTYNGWS